MRRPLSIVWITFLLMVPFFSFAVGAGLGHEAEPGYTLSDTSAFVRGPTVNLVTNSSATLFWRTSSAENSIVHFGKNSSVLEMESNSTLVTNHYIKLDSLDMGAKYYYTVESSGVESDVYHFLTAPADGSQFKLIFAGDNRPDTDTAPNQPAVFSEIADRIIAEEPNIVVLTGDFVYNVGTSNADNLYAWSLLTNITDRIGHYAPVIGVIGNHDTGASSGSYQPQYYLDAFFNTGEDKTYFSLNYAGVHFTILDSEVYGQEGRITGAQWDWLVQDLANNMNRLKFVFAHRPLFPITHIGSGLDVNKTERDALQALFEADNVTLFGAGHDHSYNRLTVDGVVHVISGGLGAPLYESSWGAAIYCYESTEVSPNAVNISTIKSDGSLYSQYDIPHIGPIEIVVREIANESTKMPGVVPPVYFSKVPVAKYFSWDGTANTTEMTGLPSAPGPHTLDIFAEDENSTWSSVRYVFTTVGSTSTTTATTTPTATTGTSSTTLPAGGNILLAVAIIGVAAVVVVVGLFVKMKKG
jgi:3',5'-cyclic AMP phosphodiesterase CpdA